MNSNSHIPVVMTDEDYSIIWPYLQKLSGQNKEMSLTHEMKRAILVKKDAFPAHCVKLNSRVKIEFTDTSKIMEFTVVTPDQADMKQKKVSILTPIGTAIIGFRKSEEVIWEVPAGVKKFRIVDVINDDPAS
jgi:regulator of nucleoside diphosphate kinase